MSLRDLLLCVLTFLLIKRLMLLIIIRTIRMFRAATT